MPRLFTPGVVILQRGGKYCRTFHRLCHLYTVDNAEPLRPAELPVSSRREEILSAIRAHQVVIIAGETAGERPTLRTWSFGELPESIVVETVCGTPLLAFPGLAIDEVGVGIRLFRQREETEAASRPGVRRLAGHGLERDLARLRKELASLLAKPSRADKALRVRARTSPRPAPAIPLPFPASRQAPSPFL